MGGEHGWSGFSLMVNILSQKIINFYELPNYLKFPKMTSREPVKLNSNHFFTFGHFFRVNIFTRKGREFFLYWAIAVNSPNNCTGGGGVPAVLINIENKQKSIYPSNTKSRNMHDIYHCGYSRVWMEQCTPPPITLSLGMSPEWPCSL